MPAYSKRLIEVDLPIKRISDHARREKYLGTITSLHLWWARRPLAACRAVICAALWPDPGDELCPDSFRQAARQLMQAWTLHERQMLLFPRVLNPESIKDTIAKGVEGGLLAYVGKGPGGTYQPFSFKQSINPSDVEFSEDMFIIPADAAQIYVANRSSGSAKPDVIGGPQPGGGPTPQPGGPNTPPPQPDPGTPAATHVAGIQWSGEVPPQKWMNFYTKVLSRYAGSTGLKPNIQIDVMPSGGVSKQTVEDTRNALRELGLNDRLEEK